MAHPGQLFDAVGGGARFQNVHLVIAETLRGGSQEGAELGQGAAAYPAGGAMLEDEDGSEPGGRESVLGRFGGMQMIGKAHTSKIPIGPGAASDPPGPFL